MSQTDQTGGRRIEVLKPCRDAWDQMKATLFPFEFRTWITLGFLAWLGTVEQGGVNVPNFRRLLPGSAGEETLAQILERIEKLVQTQLPLVLALAAAGCVLFLAILAALTYLSARGTFMYLECVHRGTAEVVKLWHRSRNHAWSYFGWRLAIALAIAGVLLVGLAWTMALTWHAIRKMTFGPDTLFTLIVAGVVVLPLVLLLGLLAWALNNLVAPIMYLRGIPGSAAWAELFGLVRRQPSAFVLYALMNFLLAILQGLLTLPVVCCTCCIGALPVVYQTILQPVFFWTRAYPLHFIGQFGPDYPLPSIGTSRVTSEPGQALVVACPRCCQQHQIPGGEAGTYACVKCGETFQVT